MDDVRPGEIRFRIHPPNRADADELISAGVFARKLNSLVLALKSADRAVNKRSIHDYKIRHLHSSSPTALICETPLKPQPDLIGRSGIDGFDSCANALTIGASD